MDEMIRYIFGSLRCSETAMRVFAKTLRKQRSFNRSTVMAATVISKSEANEKLLRIAIPTSPS